MHIGAGQAWKALVKHSSDGQSATPSASSLPTLLRDSIVVRIGGSGWSMDHDHDQDGDGAEPEQAPHADVKGNGPGRIAMTHGGTMKQAACRTATGLSRRIGRTMCARRP